MSIDNFDQQVESAQERLQMIQVCANSSSTQQNELLVEVISELSISLEELSVAAEELR